MTDVTPSGFSPDLPPPSQGAGDVTDLDLSPPASLSLPLWRSLLLNLMDRVSPEKLPPLRLTSRPVDVGLLIGDLVSLPWYRTVFSSIGDVVAPETLPPLQLESRPVEVGELIGDQLGHGWWTSLAGNLRDRLAAGHAAPLHLTAKAVDPGGWSGWLQLPRWSSVIDAPKVFLADPPKAASTPPAPTARAGLTASPVAPLDPQLVLLEKQMRHDLRLAHVREALWLSLLAGEVAFLLVALLRG
jgi:hypothetical protein